MKEELLEIKERFSTVLKAIDIELGLGQGFVIAHEDKMGLGLVKPMAALARFGAMKRQWILKGKKLACEPCGPLP